MESWSWENWYSFEGKSHAPIFLIYAVLGKAASALGIKYSIMYLINKTVFSMFLVLSLSLFSRELRLWKWWVPLLACCSGGFEWYGINQWFSNGITFNFLGAESYYSYSVFFVPHFVLSQTAMIMYFIFFGRLIQKRKVIDFTCAVLSLVIIVMVHPYMFVLPVGSTLIYLFLVRKANKKLLSLTVVIFVLPFMLLLYYVWIFSFDKSLNLWIKTSSIFLSPPGISKIILVLAIPLSLAIYGIFKWQKHAAKEDKMLILSWITTAFLLPIMLYVIPFNGINQCRFSEGISIVFFWAACGTMFLPKPSLKALCIFFLLIGPVLCLAIPFQAMNTVKHNKNPGEIGGIIYISQDNLKTYQWLEQNTKGKLVLADPYIGLRLPSRAFCKTYIGHWSETPDFVKKLNEIKYFYNFANKEEKKKFIKNISPDYIFWRKNVFPNARLDEIWPVVYANKSNTILKIVNEPKNL